MIQHILPDIGPVSYTTDNLITSDDHYRFMIPAADRLMKETDKKFPFTRNT